MIYNLVWEKKELILIESNNQPTNDVGSVFILDQQIARLNEELSQWRKKVIYSVTNSVKMEDLAEKRKENLTI